MDVTMGEIAQGRSTQPRRTVGAAHRKSRRAHGHVGWRDQHVTNPGRGGRDPKRADLDRQRVHERGDSCGVLLLPSYAAELSGPARLRPW